MKKNNGCEHRRGKGRGFWRFACGFFRGIKFLFFGIILTFKYMFKTGRLFLSLIWGAMRQVRDRSLSLFRFNITFKLTLGFAWIMFLFLNIFNFLIFCGVRNSVYEEEMRSLDSGAKLVLREIGRSGIGETVSSHEYLESIGIEFALVDGNSDIQYSNGFEGFQKLETVPLYEYRYFDISLPRWVYRKASIGGGRALIFRNYMGDSIFGLQKFAAASWSVSFALYILVVAMARRMSIKHLRPIRIMTKKVMDISSTDLSTRLDVSGTKDELKDLAVVFNKMISDIESSYEKQKQFVSDASHELRTPIAVIKGYANMLSRWGKEDQSILEESISAIADEAEGMQSLVESLLFIARSDKDTLKMEKDIFDISELMDEIVRQTRLIDKTHNIGDDIESGCMIHGSAEKLKQAIRIFIDNSIRYTPQGGEIRISMKSTAKDIVISIRDTGIGMSSEDMDHIFERFYRADKSRTRLDDEKSSGSGLGLAIAKIIIDAHCGTIHVESEIECGTCFTIIMPKTVLKDE